MSRRDLAKETKDPGTRSAPPSIIFDACVSTIALTLLGAALWFFIRGHNDAGGGFIAGLLSGSALVILNMRTPRSGARTSRERRDLILIASGLTALLIAALSGVLAGGVLLEGLWLSAKLPIVGKVGTPVLFDAGVLLVVTGMTARVHAALTAAGDLP
jgi:multicomponent Na+:H+ antiporter subunit B